MSPRLWNDGTSGRRPHLWIFLAVAIGTCGAGPGAWPAPPPQAPVWPPAPDLPRIRYVTTISQPKDIGAGPSWLGRAASVVLGRKRQPRLQRPRAMAVDRTGRLLIADPEQRMVHVLDIGRHKYSYLESAPFASPVGVAVGPDNRVYVTDSGRRRVFVYDADGKRRAALGVVNGEAIFVRPTGIAVSPDGNLYVVDTAAAQIQVLSPDGRVLQTLGSRGRGDGEFNFPTDIAIGRDGRIYVLDSMNARLQVLEPDGRFVRQFGQRGNGSGDLDKPKGVALDSDGHVYIAEAMHDVVQIFDADGRLLLVVGQSGSGPGEFSLPSGILIDAANHVYVADSLNSRVQVFQYVAQPETR